MSLGALTLTVPVNAVNKVLKRVNQDNFATKYYLREATQEFTVDIRHSKEKRGGIEYQVHNVSLKVEVFATETAPTRIRDVWFTFRHTKVDDFSAIGHAAIGLADLIKVAGNVDDLLALVG